MGTRKKTTLIKEEVADVRDESNPAVVAYRVGQLEEKQEKGFKDLGDKIDKYLESFVTVKDFDEYKTQAEKDNAERDTKIQKLEDFKDKIITRIAGGAVTMFILMVLAWYGLDKLFK